MEPPQVRRLGSDHDPIERGLRRQRSLAYVSCLHVGCESTRQTSSATAARVRQRTTEQAHSS